jgi:hypothetical protein
VAKFHLHDALDSRGLRGSACQVTFAMLNDVLGDFGLALSTEHRSTLSSLFDPEMLGRVSIEGKFFLCVLNPSTTHQPCLVQISSSSFAVTPKRTKRFEHRGRSHQKQNHPVKPQMRILNRSYSRYHCCLPFFSPKRTQLTLTLLPHSRRHLPFSDQFPPSRLLCELQVSGQRWAGKT